ncbi:MAG: invasion associated locus B family protein [Alphaproteobacteria bacterium]
MTVFSRCSAAIVLVLAVAGPGAHALDDVPLPRPAPESIKPDQPEPSEANAQVAAPAVNSPVIGAKAAEFQQVKDWTVKCRTGGQKRCILYQTVLFGHENPSVIVARAGFVDGVSDPVLEVRVPMGVRLATGLTVAVDGQPAITLPFERCAQEGCVAQALLRQDLLAKLKQGRKLDLQVEDQARNTVNVRMSLVGFSTALDMTNE